jgi:hypothetical protein
MLLLAVLLAAPAALPAADAWVTVRSGPFEVYTSAGGRAARELLADLEQFRNAFRQVTGKEEVSSVWPIRVVLFDSARRAQGCRTGGFELRRDGWAGGLVKGQRPPFAALTRILLESNLGPLPEEVERGLEAVFSTLAIDRTRVVLGEPPPAPERTPAWAKMHLLAVTAEYGGRVRVLLSNLEQGADYVAAYKNAFARTPEEIDRAAAAYAESGNLELRKLTGAPIDPARDYRVRDVAESQAAVLVADLREGEAAQAGYRDVLNRYGSSPEALEGLGLYEEAVAAGSTSARCHLEHALRLADPVKARAALENAAALNPRWAEPVFRLALLAADASEKLRYLRKAVLLAPRRSSYWEALAEAALTAKEFTEAGRAWAAAERAAGSPQERERLRLARRRVEAERIAHAEEAKRRERDQIAQLKEKLLENIREAEARVARKNAEAPPGEKVVEWWDDPRPAEKLRGKLVQVDCIGAQARLAVDSPDGKRVQLLIRDATQVVILGGGEQTLRCGPQKPPREALIEFVKQTDAKLKTAGEVRLIEFLP